MNKQSDFDRFKNLTFEDFKKLAKDDSLSQYQKVGFPDAYRENKEHIIFEDIINKLNFQLEDKNGSGVLLDIGPGCSDLPKMIIDHCDKLNFKILLVDSKEMLDQLPTKKSITKFEGYFPNDVLDLVNQYQNKVDYIVGYSIFHYVFYNTCIFKFLDTALSLLKPGGKMLIGDIPNITKRKRFFSTQTGIEFHKNFTGTDTLPEVNHLQLEPTHIDDGVLMGIVQRYRNFGFEAYLLPQPSTLPFHNRREDLVIYKI
ncbi:class I SAM-dependent methyltransferase [Aquiflexum sp. TKW24L]|uniref:class I SAM-dependent methyltransferase n=1 Tax=Aquiflexum sp. TKW24L TaxID=2942212 RepID=UPI0020C11997|nr:class I SAM-dependent methyltransferase [Aquiflexum sp. TKW24L]MCL6261234.1 class I SAM-dependent methyltransferase [Aquiflexum sp. TKW24L]